MDLAPILVGQLCHGMSLSRGEPLSVLADGAPINALSFHNRNYATIRETTESSTYDAIKIAHLAWRAGPYRHCLGQ
jgi:hypothetical protein